MTDTRPDPSKLLEELQDAERRARRGKLKVFFGAAPGVGKTFAMLSAARRLYTEGVDVVIGYVETHGRYETQSLLLGMEILARREVDYRDSKLPEFDLEAALARKPEILVVDELAHTNAPGSRFPKRWQDVNALLEAGINVYTTLNVQHLESLNDVVAQITGIEVRETVPDSVLEEADEVELIDLPPDLLLERLRSGRVYVPEAARTAEKSFFRKGNLTALRELALRRTAEWVDVEMRSYKREQGIARVWPASERIVACVGPSENSARMLRAAKRLAVGLRADLIAVYVETPASVRLSEEAKARAVAHLRLAESLGAETVTLSGSRPAEQIVHFARQRNASKIVVGKSERPAWKRFLAPSLVDELIHESGELDVFVITGEADTAPPLPHARLRAESTWQAYAKAAGIVVVSTLVAALMFNRFAEANIAMVYLLGVVVAAARLSYGPAILAAVLSVAAFDFVFVPPYFTFAVSDSQYLITFLVMLGVGLFITNRTARIREQAASALERERRTGALYAMSRELASSRDLDEIMACGVRHLRETFDCQVAVLLPAPDGNLAAATSDTVGFDVDASDLGVAQWAFDHGQTAGLGTSTLPSSKTMCLPLVASQGKLGVLGVRPRDEAQLLAPQQLHLLETFANQLALAIERGRLIRETQDAQVQAESERLRSALLSSVSHDLRTPLSVITGAASSLLDERTTVDAAVRTELAQSIYSEAQRLNELIGNLIFATRVESGAVELHKEWISLEEIVGAALNRSRERMADRPLTVRLPRDLPLVRGDAVMLEQVLLNLLENTLKHTESGSPIEISAWATRKDVVVQVADRGKGLQQGEERRVFERFYRGSGSSGGLGLGLAICRGIVVAHGGRIWAENRPDGGAQFRFSLPMEPAPPAVPEEVGGEGAVLP